MKKKNSFLLFIFLTVVILGAMMSCKKDNTIKNTSPDVKFIEISNAKIAYKIFGSGEPLIMCMGYASNMDLWSTGVIERLQKTYKVIVFDYRGMGLSTNTDPSFTISSLADDVNALLTALNIDKTHVLGWSMGGYVAQMFAVNYPEKVDKLVLYATNCGDTLTIDPSQEIIDILDDPSATPAARLGILFPDDWLATHPEPWKTLPDAKEPYNGETIGLQYVAVQDWLTPGGGSAARLHELTLPVLLICGDQDKVVPCENSSILDKLLPNSTLIKVSDSGHGFMFQLPETFADYVSSFLAE